MDGIEQQSAGSSLAALVSTAGGTDRMVFVVSGSHCTERFLKGLLSSLGHGEIYLISLGGQPLESLTARCRGEFVFEDENSWASEFITLSRRLRRVPRRALLVINWLGVPAGWQGDVAQRTVLLRKLEKLIANHRRQSAWFLAQEVFARDEWASIKGDAGLYCHFWPLGGHLYCQTLVQPRSADPIAHLPRRVGITDSGIVLDEPIFPDVLPSEPGKTAEIAEPDALFDRLAEPYRRAFQTGPFPGLLFSFNERHLEPNEKLCAFLGCSRHDFPSLRLSDIISAPHQFHVKRSLVKLRHGGRATVHCDVRNRRGKYVPSSVSFTAVAEDLFSAVLMEETETATLRDQLKSLEQRHQTVLQEAPYALGMIQGKRFVEYNPAFLRLFPWVAAGEGAHRTLNHVFGERSTDGVRALQHLVADADRDQKPQRAEIRFVSPDGIWVEAEVHAIPCSVEKKRAARVAFVDITERKALFRTLESSEGRYRTLVESSAAAMAVVHDGRFLFVNKGFLELFGYLLPDDLVTRELAVCASGRDRKRLAELVRPTGRGPHTESLRMDFSGVRKDGSKLYVQMFAEPLHFEGQPSLLCYFVDITSIREAATNLEKRIQQVDLTDQLLRSLHQSLDMSSVVPKGFETVRRAVNYEAGVVYLAADDGKVLSVAAHEGVAGQMLQILEAQSAQEGLTGFIAKTHEPIHFAIDQYPPYLPFRSLFESENVKAIAGVPLLDHEHLTGILLLFSRDPVEPTVHDEELLRLIGGHFGAAISRAREYERIRDLYALYHSALENGPEIVYETTPNGTYRYLHPGVEQLVGFRVRELTASAELWRNLVHPDDRSTYSRRISDQHSDVQGTVLEYRILPKGKAAYRRVRDTVRYDRDQDRNVRAIHGAITDITEEESSESETRGAEKILRDVLDTMGDALILTDLQGSIHEVNSAFTELTGYSRQDVKGMGMPYPWLLEDEMRTYVQWLDELRAKQSSYDFDMNWRRRDGRETAISLSTTLLRNASGEPIGMLNLARDISARKRQSRELQALLTISSTISSSLDLQDVLSVACEQSREIVGADIVLCYLPDESRENLVLVRHVGSHETLPSALQVMSVQDDALGQVVSDKEPFILTDGLPDDERIQQGTRGALQKLNLHSLAVLPLLSKDIVQGVLLVGFTGTGVVAEREHPFLSLIGNQLGTAIDNAKLYSEVQSQVRQVTVLYELGKKLTGVQDVEMLLQVAATTVFEALPSELVAAQRYDHATSLLQPAFVRARPGKARNLPPWGDHVGETHPFAHVFGGKEALLGWIDGSLRFCAAPVVARGRVQAVLCAVGGGDTPLGNEHLRLLASIASLVNIAYDRVALYEETVAKAREIELRNEELDRFAYVVSHDLKEPLITIEGYAKIVQGELDTTLPEEARQRIASILRSIDRMKRLINDLLTLSRIGRVAAIHPDVALSESLAEVLHEMEFTLRERNVRVMVPDGLPIVAYDPTHLGVVFRNLISNAVKFNTQVEPRVEISAVEEAHAFLVAITDNGIGIKESDQERIFTIFQRLHPAEQFDGTGAGLTIVKKIVESHGGTIGVESQPGAGSTFTFTIPKYDRNAPRNNSPD